MGSSERRTQVTFPALLWRASQPPVTPAPGDHGADAQTCIDPHSHTHVYMVKIKINLF